MNKTGTTSLGLCLQQLGFRHTSFDLDLLRAYCQGDVERLFQVADAYDSFEDWPWPLAFRELDERYPQAKFILTVRKDSETWLRSLLSHAKRTGPTEARKLVYGYAMPQGHEIEHIRIYETHNAEVQRHFQDRPDKLLVVCWETGSGWPELGRFLGVETPSGPIPHANKASAAWRRWLRRRMVALASRTKARLRD
ncbi:MAG: hypothetical protein GXP42_12405 [Chloroflexi bacterium]|nr:hypothetical protein [Chloroflexota bacterium]